MFAQRGREAWRNLLDAFDGERARHGERGAGAGIVDGHERAAVQHLPVDGDVRHLGHHFEGEAVAVEDLLPLRERALGEDQVEDGHEGCCMPSPGRRGGKARVGGEVGPLDRAEEGRSVAIVVRDVQEKPTLMTSAPRSARIVVATGPAM